MSGRPRHDNAFSAAEGALGYLFQCRYALLHALRRVRAGEQFVVLLEAADDVVFEGDASPREILQTKHHTERSANLTDASPDLWRTLRVWCDGTTNGTIPPFASLCLITTSSAGGGSAASYLRADGRNAKTAAQRLVANATTSTNQANKPGYQAFLKLSPDQQLRLVERVTVFDVSPNIIDLDAELRGEVRWAADSSYLESFVRRLEGWWLNRVVRQLSNKSRDPIHSSEFEHQMDDLREQFKREALPVDEDILATQVDDSVYQNAVFVRQLHLIGVSPARTLAAIRDYFRAYEQRSRWAREDLLYVGELGKYESRLTEEWQLVFERVKDEFGLSGAAAEELKRKAAREVYRWVEERVIPIRPNVTEPFVTRGSLHMLSDRLRVGWHTDFLERLRHLLNGTEVAS